VCPKATRPDEKEVEHQSDQRQVGSSEEHQHYLGAVALREAYPRQRCVGFEVIILQLFPKGRDSSAPP
jgi:hypothetical protein